MKRQGIRGLALHVAIVTLVTLVVASPVPYGWAAALLVGVGHFVIDAIRTYPLRNWERFPLVYFIVDQCAHVALLVWVARLIQPERYNTLTDYLCPVNDWDYLMLVTAALVFLIFTIPIIDALLYQCLMGNGSSRNLRVTNRTRLLGAIERVLGFYLMLTPAICLTPLVFVPHFLYRFARHSDDPLLYRLLRPTLSFFFTLIVGWFVLIATRASQEASLLPLLLALVR